MKLTIQKSALAQALSAVSAVVSNRNSLPYLQMVKLSALDSGHVSITATDMDCFYTRIIEAVVGGDYIKATDSCLIPAARIKEWLGMIHSESIAIETAGNHILLTKEGGGPIKFSTIEAEKFPKQQEEESKVLATVDFAPLKHIIPAIIGANEGRPQLEAAFVEHVNKRELICAATNGRQVATVSIKGVVDDVPWPAVAIPSKYVNLISSLGECDFLDSKNDIHFCGPNFKLSVRKTEYGIAPWRRAIQNEQFPIVGSIIVMREEFAEAINECHVHRGNELGSEYGVRVSIGKADGGMQISCFVNKTADSKSEIVQGRIKGEFPPVIISTEYLIPFLKLSDNSPLKIEFTSSKTMVKMSAPEISVEYFFAPCIPVSGPESAVKANDK